MYVILFHYLHVLHTASLNILVDMYMYVILSITCCRQLHSTYWLTCTCMLFFSITCCRQLHSTYWLTCTCMLLFSHYFLHTPSFNILVDTTCTYMYMYVILFHYLLHTASLNILVDTTCTYMYMYVILFHYLLHTISLNILVDTSTCTCMLFFSITCYTQLH